MEQPGALQQPRDRGDGVGEHAFEPVSLLRERREDEADEGGEGLFGRQAEAPGETVARVDRVVAHPLEAEEVAHLIADVLDAPNDEAVLTRVRGQVAVLCRKFPVYGA